MRDYRQLLLKLLPPVSYDRNGKNIRVDFDAYGNALNQVQNYAKKALNAVTPFYADELLEDWERVLGLATNKSTLYQVRLNRVIEKLMEIGGLSIPYFISLAKKMGYEITITEGASEIFRAGVNRAGDPLGDQGLMWVWRVNVKSQFKDIYYFRAGVSRANDPLSQYSDPVIESVFNDLKPAFTHCTFFYE